MRKKSLRTAALVLAFTLAMTGCGKKDEKDDKTTVATTEATTEATKDTETTTEEVTETTETTTEATTEATTEDIPEDIVYDDDQGDYHLVWSDEFDGDKLNEDDWNREIHSPGWVNAEWQAYTKEEEYAYVKDGKLVIQPTKKENNFGQTEYYSGRVNTNNKHTFKYGRFEARIKVPEGKGFLPAFWMMPELEGYYGVWPKCGEIDIMEVLGDNLNTQYGTLHFGEPHTQRQGTYQIEGDFSKEYHVFAVDWEPGLITWYVDGHKFYETNDWFTKYAGGEEKPYPAPFNQNFYIILNVAVGGTWPGDPDETTIFDERAAMYVDYVRVYQKDEYDENVEKPVREYKWKEADESGNFVTNSDFAEAEDLTDDVDWKYMNFNDGDGAAEIKDGEMIITTKNAGTVDYAIQLVQPNMPMHKDSKYRLSFEAKADEKRTLITTVSAPEVNWIRYFPDTKVDLDTDWQEYSFEFDMTEADDDMGRVEFNMGNQGSTATIHIKNVRLEIID